MRNIEINKDKGRQANDFIEVGPGCEIDPEETIGSCGTHDMIQTLAKKLEKAYEALQQREERRKMVVDRCRALLVRYRTKQKTSLRANICEQLQQFVAILEGTDG